MERQRPGLEISPWDDEYAESADEMVPMLTVREVAQLLNIHSNTLRRWSDRGRIRAYRINHRGDRRFRQDDIVRFAHELRAHEGNDREVSVEWL